jgi:hypothetical protein
LLQIISDQVVNGGDPDLTEQLMQYYSSLLQTIYILNISITGGLDWGDAAAPLGGINGSVQVSYAFYISFSFLCMFNVVTGCLVDKAVKTSALDEDRMMLEEIEQRKKWLLDIKKLFDIADKDGSEYLDKQEFIEITGDARMRHYFRKIGLDMEVDNVHGIFELLDMEGDGRVDVDEFTTALQHLHGPARAIDLARIQHGIKKSQKLMETMQRTMEAQTRSAPPAVRQVAQRATAQTPMKVSSISPDLPGQVPCIVTAFDLEEEGWM